MITKLDPQNIKIGDKVTIADNMDRYAGEIHNIIDDGAEGLRIIVRQHRATTGEILEWELKWDKIEKEFLNKCVAPYLQVFRGSVEFHPEIEDILLDYIIQYDPLKLPDGIIVEGYIDKGKWRYGSEGEPKQPDDDITIATYPNGDRNVIHTDMLATMMILFDVSLDWTDMLYYEGDEGFMHLTDEASERYMTQKARG